MPQPTKLADVVFAGHTETGPVRQENQDFILVPDSPLPGVFAFLFGLADGMGGYDCGDVASKLALSTFRQYIIDSSKNTLAIEKMLKQAVDLTNLEVFKAAHALDIPRMGTTLTAAYIFGDQLYLTHLGDSRAYLIRNGAINCLSNDHTIVGDMVRSRLIPPSAIRTHERRSILTRAVGMELFVTPDISIHRLLAGDRLILCSDGVWSVLEDEEINEIAGKIKNTQQLASDLVNSAIGRESDDNCSAVIADFQYFRPLSVPQSEIPRRKWLGFMDRS